MPKRSTIENRFSHDVDQSRFQRLIEDRMPQKIAKVAFAGLAVLAAARLTTESLSIIGEQHGGESTGAQVTDLFTKDFNHWNLLKTEFVGDNTGHHPEQTINDLAEATLLAAATVAKSKPRR